MHRPGDIIDERYQLTRPLGKRGSAEIWEAEHEVVGRRVNLKLLAGDVAQDSRLRERFIGEARAASVIAHPSAVEVYDVGVTTDGIAYLVTEPIGGEMLCDVLSRQGTFPVEDACQVAVQVLEGLEAAHAAGITHGALEPASIVLRRGRSEQLHVKILDFGTDLPPASLDASNDPLIETGPDIRSMGAILYEMLTGRPAFPRLPSLASSGAREGCIEPIGEIVPAVPAAVADIVGEALAEGPRARVTSAKEMAKLLSPYAAKRSPSLAPRESVMPFLSPEARRTRGMARLELAVLGKPEAKPREAQPNMANLGANIEERSPADNRRGHGLELEDAPSSDARPFGKSGPKKSTRPAGARRLAPEELIDPRIPRPPRTPRHFASAHPTSESSIPSTRVRLPRRRSIAARQRAKMVKSGKEAAQPARPGRWTWWAGLLAAAGLGTGLLLAHFLHF